MRIVTTGLSFTDIDAYAGCVAYAELLNKQGIPARAVSTAPLNESINQTILSWNAPFSNRYEPSAEDSFTVIDVSEPHFLDKIVDHDRIEEIIDHHPGFEDYWRDRGTPSVTIDFIGAACTLVYERWENAGLLDEMSPLSAKLLVCGILDNTLNFGAKVTTDRDRAAYEVLLKKSGLPDDWAKTYSQDCQLAIFKDPVGALRGDTKDMEFTTYPHRLRVGQAAAWDGADFVSGKSAEITEAMSAYDEDWFVNVISLSEGASYFVSPHPAVREWLTGLLSVKFDGNTAKADRLWLRKEIIKEDINRERAQ